MRDIALQKLPPQSVEAEESILSACMLDHAKDIVDLLNADDFYRTPHQKIFSAIEDLVSQKINVDLTTVVSLLRDKESLEDVGGASYISRLIDIVPVSATIKDHVDIIKNASKKRKIIASCNKTIENCYNGAGVNEILIGLDREISSIDTHDGQCVRIGDLLEETLDGLEELKSNPGMSGIPTGLKDIDTKTGGLQGGELIVIGARPSMGKSALGMRFARGAAYAGHPALFISIEMPRGKVVKRELSCVSQVDGARFRNGDLSQSQWDKIIDAADTISEMPLWIDDSPTADIKSVQSKIRSWVRENGKGLVVADYLQYIRGLKSERKDIEIGTISRGLAVSAKDHDIPIVLLAQLSRSLESRPDKRPIMSDLRGSGEIEQDADIIGFLYRDEVYNPETKHKGVAELEFKKFRDGDPGKVWLTWVPHRTTFENLAPRRYAQ